MLFLGSGKRRWMSLKVPFLPFIVILCNALQYCHTLLQGHIYYVTLNTKYHQSIIDAVKACN